MSAMNPVSSTSELTGYGEMATLMESLPFLLREARRARHLSLRKAGLSLGMAGTTILRIESGEDTSVSNAVAIFRWLEGMNVDA